MCPTCYTKTRYLSYGIGTTVPYTGRVGALPIIRAYQTYVMANGPEQYSANYSLVEWVTPYE